MIQNNITPRKSLVLFLGSYRPFVPKDFAEDIIKNIQTSSYELKKVYVYSQDPLLGKTIDGVQVEALPDFLEARASRIKEDIQKEDNKNKWEALIREIEGFQLDIGMIIYTYWMPPELFSIPQRGFVNFHPGPLPMIRGFEPETAGILLGLQNFSGTYHKVSEEFDLGELYEASPDVIVNPNTTAYGLYVRVTETMARTIGRFLNRMYKNKLELIPQEPSEGFTTNMTYIKDQATIHFKYDTINLLDRKNRAINGQDFPYPLGFLRDGERIIVYNLVVQKGVGELEAGKFIGQIDAVELELDEKWHDAPIFSLPDGLCALQIKEEIMDESEITDPNMNPTKPRAHLTEFVKTEDEDKIAKYLHFLLISLEQNLD